MKQPTRTYYVLLNDTGNALGIFDTQEKAKEVQMEMWQWKIKHVRLTEVIRQSKYIPKWPWQKE